MVFVDLFNYNLNMVITSIMALILTMVFLQPVSMIFPKILKKSGFMLFSTAVIGLISEVLCILAGYSADIVNCFTVFVVSLFIGYYLVKAQKLEHTVGNAINSGLSFYSGFFVDIILSFITGIKDEFKFK